MASCVINAIMYGCYPKLLAGGLPQSHTISTPSSIFLINFGVHFFSTYIYRKGRPVYLLPAGDKFALSGVANFVSLRANAREKGGK